MTGDELKEMNLYKLRLARKVLVGVIPLNYEESQQILALARGIDDLVSTNGGDTDVHDF